MTQPRFAGHSVQLGGATYHVAPLALGAVKRLAGQIQSFQSADLAAQVDVAVQVLHASLVRNHPDLTTEQVEELVDMGNMQSLFGQVMALSGFVAQPQDGGGGNAPGPTPGTGQPSMPASPPVLAGPSSTSTTASP